jgi:hypothetical protein
VTRCALGVCWFARVTYCRFPARRFLTLPRSTFRWSFPLTTRSFRFRRLLQKHSSKDLKPAFAALVALLSSLSLNSTAQSLRWLLIFAELITVFFFLC